MTQRCLLPRTGYELAHIALAHFHLILNPCKSYETCPVWMWRIYSHMTWEPKGSTATHFTSMRSDAVVCCQSPLSKPALPASLHSIQSHRTSPVRTDAASGLSVCGLLIVDGLLSFDLVSLISVLSYCLFLLRWVSSSWVLEAEARLVIWWAASSALPGSTLAIADFRWNPWYWH